MVQQKKVLLYGYINTNVLDGSAIFMASLCNVLAKDPSNHIDLLLATPYKREVVLQSVKDLNNVNIIDPFKRESFSSFDFYDNEYMNIYEAGELISKVDQENSYDHIFVRSLDVTNELIKHNTGIVKKLLTYITGITSGNEEIPENLKKLLVEITSNGGRLLCQTDQMKRHIVSKVDIDSQKIIDLKPMIPDITTPFRNLFTKKEVYNEFCYTGKFAKEWNTIPMIAQFREVVEYYPDAKLYLAGDQFKAHKDDPDFKSNAVYLVKNSKNVEWYGALTRKQAMSLIKQSDIGLTWRSSELDQSLELSTKLLEYCSLAKPPILNRTEMHIDIFGEDYPFFADSEEEFFNTIEKILMNPHLVEETAERVYEVAKNYTFSATYSRLAPYLLSDEQSVEKQMYELVNKVNISNETIETGDFLAIKLDYKTIIEQAQKICAKGHISMYKIINDILIVKYGQREMFDDEMYFRFLQDLITTYYENTVIELEKDDPITLTPVKEEQATKIKTTNGVSERKYRKAKEFADLANEKYKETMEKYKELLVKYKQLEEENKVVKRNYKVLSTSKLGKVQRKYWKMRKS